MRQAFCLSNQWQNQMAANSWTVKAQETGQRLDKFLAGAARLGSRSKAARAIESGKVFVNENEMSGADAARQMQPGDVVRLWMNRPGSAHRRTYSRRQQPSLPIVFEDDQLLVINKPAGLLTVRLEAQPDEDSLENRLGKYLRSHGRKHPLAVHRIDRDTTGLVVFAKTESARQHLKQQFFNRQPQRIYQAIVHGIPEAHAGRWRDLVRWDQQYRVQKLCSPKNSQAHEAICTYRVLETFTQASLLEIALITGKRNQIRLQAAVRGHQLIGEKIYLSDPPPDNDIGLPRQALHAYQLAFCHPTTNKVMEFESPLPEDLEKLLRKLRSWTPAAC